MYVGLRTAEKEVQMISGLLFHLGFLGFGEVPHQACWILGFGLERARRFMSCLAFFFLSWRGDMIYMNPTFI